MEIHHRLPALVESVVIDGKDMKIVPRIVYDIATILLIGAVYAAINVFLIYVFFIL
jgi:hypothetical protein